MCIYSQSDESQEATFLTIGKIFQQEKVWLQK